MILLYGTVWVRASLPRLRYDQLMDLGWKWLIELAFLWVMVSGGDHRRPRGGLGPAASSSPPPVLGALARARLPAPLHAEAGRDPGRGLLMGRFSGFGVTIKQVFKKPVTTRYPKEKRPKPERFHGRHVLNRYDDGMEKCIGCELCAGVCPARCIYVRGADNPPDAPGLAGRAVRLRLRDQLPALHPLRPLRRGVPDRGDHRDEAVRVLLRGPGRRDLHEGRAAGRRRRAARSASRGSCGSAARTTRRARGCGRRRRPGRPRTRAGSSGRASSGFGYRQPEQGQRRKKTET